MTSPTTADRVRQITLAASAVLALVGSTWGSGAFGGTPIAEASGGALATDATLVSPGGPAFSVWSVIYAGLVALAIFQLLPGRAADPRQRRVGWWVCASLWLNFAWILAVQADLLAGSVIVILALLVVLVIVFRRLAGTSPSGRLEPVVVDGTMNLYLGWVCAATTANTVALISAENGAVSDADGAPWAILALAAALALGVVLAALGRGRIMVSVGLGWGLFWIGWERLAGEPESTTVGVAAFVALALLVLATVLFRLTAGRQGRPSTSLNRA